jgi:hypothetical protein
MPEDFSIYGWTENEPSHFDDHLDDLNDPDKKLPMQVHNAAVLFDMLHRWTFISRLRRHCGLGCRQRSEGQEAS